MLPHQPQCSSWSFVKDYLVPRSRSVWKCVFFFLSLSSLSFICTFSSFVLSDSADVESLGQDSSAEENEEGEEDEQKAEVTSMDEALRTVTGAADRSPEDFLKQNFEMLAESCSMGRRAQTLTCNIKGTVSLGKVMVAIRLQDAKPANPV